MRASMSLSLGNAAHLLARAPSAVHDLGQRGHGLVAEQDDDRVGGARHLCDAAKAIYGLGTDLADQWTKDRCAELDARRLCAILAVLRIHVERCRDHARRAQVHMLC